MQLVDFSSELSLHHRGDSEHLLSLSLNIMSVLQDSIHDVFEVDVVSTEHGCSRHDEILHSFPHIQVEIHVAAGYEAYDFILKYEEGDPFSTVKVSLV